MWKKGVPIIILSGVLLVGCNNGTVSNNNETPKQDVRDEADKNNEENMNTNQKENNVEDVEREADGDETQVEIIEEFNRENDVAE